MNLEKGIDMIYKYTENTKAKNSITLITKLNKMVNDFFGYQVKDDNTKEFSKMLQTEIQEQYTDAVQVSIVGEFAVEITVNGISIAKLNIDSDGEMMWINRFID
jgi:hypothetical protein